MAGDAITVASGEQALRARYRDIHDWSPYLNLRMADLTAEMGDTATSDQAREFANGDRRALGDERFYVLVLERIGELREMPYADYLRTTEWALTRDLALRRAGHRCQVCNGNRRLQVHHRTYDRVRCERLDDLTVLCRDCHAGHHGKSA